MLGQQFRQRLSEAERNWSTLAVQFATRLSLLYEVLDRSSPSRVRFAAQQQRALDCCGPFQETPLSKRERLKTERDQSAANLDLFFTATDTTAATKGKAACRKEDNSPISTSRLISSPTKKKKTDMSPSLIHSRRVSERKNRPNPIETCIFHSSL